MCICILKPKKKNFVWYVITFENSESFENIYIFRGWENVSGTSRTSRIYKHSTGHSKASRVFDYACQNPNEKEFYNMLTYLFTFDRWKGYK